MPVEQAKLPEQTASQVKFAPCERSELRKLASQKQFYQVKQSKSKQAN